MPKYSAEFKDQVCQEVENIKNVVLVARKHEIPHSTIHTWLRKREGKIDFKKRPIDQEASVECKKLKKELAKKDAEIMILKDLLKKTYQIWDTD